MRLLLYLRQPLDIAGDLSLILVTSFVLGYHSLLLGGEQCVGCCVSYLSDITTCLLGGVECVGCCFFSAFRISQLATRRSTVCWLLRSFAFRLSQLATRWKAVCWMFSALFGDLTEFFRMARRTIPFSFAWTALVLPHFSRSDQHISSADHRTTSSNTPHPLARLSKHYHLRFYARYPLELSPPHWLLAHLRHHPRVSPASVSNSCSHLQLERNLIPLRPTESIPLRNNNIRSLIALRLKLASMARSGIGFTLALGLERIPYYCIGKLMEGDHGWER